MVRGVEHAIKNSQFNTHAWTSRVHTLVLLSSGNITAWYVPKPDSDAFQLGR